MADKPDPKNDQDQEPSEEDVFFGKMRGVLDSWFDEKMEKIRETGTGRNGRATLPAIVANLMFGKPESK